MQTEPRVLAETEFLGMAYTEVPLNFSGPCAVRLDGRTQDTCVFPNEAQANEDLRFAIGFLGGYNRALVSPAQGQAPTHASWEDWAFS